MYGLVHCSIRDMLRDQYGEETSAAVLKAADVSSDVFLTMSSYDDDITLRLVAAAASHLDKSLENYLRELGRYWMTEFAPRAYRSLLDQAGTDLATFLGHLNPLHDRIGTSFVNFSPPRFEVTVIDETVIELQYSSHRHGLKYFLEGILEGLCDYLGQPASIKEIFYATGPAGDTASYRISTGEAA